MLFKPCPPKLWIVGLKSIARPGLGELFTNPDK
jgi:hypothetical protein